MGLFGPKYDNKNVDKALAYVRRETDEAKLLDAALNSQHRSVRAEAARMLKSDESIITILKDKSFNPELKKELMPGLSNRSLLDQLFDDPDLFIQFWARKYAGRDEGAFQVIKWDMEKSAGRIFEPAPYLLGLNKEQALYILKNWKVVMGRVEADLFNEIVPDREEFELCMMELALDAENEFTRNRAASLISIPAIRDRYEFSAKAARQKREYEQKIHNENEDKNKLYHIINTEIRMLIREELPRFHDPNNRLKAELELVTKARQAQSSARLADEEKYAIRNYLKNMLSRQEAVGEYLMTSVARLDQPESRFILTKVSDEDILRKLASGATSRYVRYMACRKIGGHHYDEAAPQKERCTCTVCGFVDHPGYKTGIWKCERCGAEIETIPFVAGLPNSIIRWDDGTEGEIDGYDGHQYNDDNPTYSSN